LLLKKTNDAEIIYFKLIIFFGVFILTSYVIKQDSYHTEEPKNWFSKKEKTMADQAIRLVQQNFFVRWHLLDIAKFLFRIIFASFVKDAMFAVFSPDKFRTPVPEKLISMVESETLDQSWIPVTEAEWKKRNETGDKSESESHSFIYNFGRTSIGHIVYTGQAFASAWMWLVSWFEWIVSTTTSVVLGMIVFVIRSVVCSCSSIFLIVLYGFQLVLRTVKQVYNGILFVLTWVCTMINDLSLLSVELIQRTVVLENEEVFVKLRDSIRTTGKDLGVRPETSTSSLQ